MRRIFLPLLLTIFIGSAFFAQSDGTLDETFGENGIYHYEFDGDNIIKFKSLDNNKMLVLLGSDIPSTPPYNLIRLNEDGSLDETFGENGIVGFEEVDSDTIRCSYPNFEVLDDGKILIVERRYRYHELTDSTYYISESNLIKLNSDGSFDTNFGTGGRLNVYFTEGYYENSDSLLKHATIIYSVTKIDENTFYLIGKPGSMVHEVRKYDYEGNLVTEFGNNGVVITSSISSDDLPAFYDLGYYREHLLEALPDENGGFYVLETHYERTNFKLHRYTAQGEKNLSFGFNGTKEFYVGSEDTTYICRKMELDPEDNVLLGFINDNNKTNTVYFYRITENGDFDETFGVNGKKKFTVNDFGGTQEAHYLFISDFLTLDDDNILLLTVFRDDYEYFYLSKLNGDGSFNAEFGNNGIVEVPEDQVSISYYYNPYIFFSLKKDDYKILVASYSSENYRRFMLSRFNNSRHYNTIHVSGNVSGVWNADTVYVDGDITVPVNTELIIARGTVVYFTGKYRMDVYGTLTAKGEADRNVVFDSPSDQPWRGINFLQTDEHNQPTSSLEYCRFTNSRAYWGDGLGPYYGTLNFDKSNVNVKNCNFYNTTGIYVSGSASQIFNTEFILTPSTNIDSGATPLFQNCRFDSSSISVYNNSAPVIDSTIIEHSWNGSATVGLYGLQCSPVIKNTVIRENGSGGVYFDQSDVTFEFVTIENNTSNYHGGGGYFNKCQTEFKNVIVRGNVSNMYNGYGGGLFFGATNDMTTVYQATFDNCLIVQNTCAERGGGVFFDFSTKATGAFTNCTIADNVSSGWAGISSSDYQPAISVNTIVWNNGDNLDFQAGGYYAYSIIQGNYTGQDTASTNLDNVDPLFRDAANGDYHLQSADCGYAQNSPAIDAGSPQINDFVIDCASAGLGVMHSDMGAYGGANNWWDRSVMPECYYAGEVSGVWDCETIKVLGDILVPSGDTLTITENVQGVYFQGPYQIIVEGTLIARGPENDRTDLNGERILFQGNDWHGIYFRNTNDRNEGTSIIENCRFDYANKTDIPYQGGGAILISNSDNVIIKHSVFYRNTAKYGGAVYISNSDATIEDCYFEINGSVITDEIQTEGGGAIYIENSNPRLHKLRLIANKSKGGGGAVIFDNSSPVVSNVLAVKNYAQTLGGAFHIINNSAPQFVNATVADNQAQAGGAFYVNTGASINVINSILYDDTKPEIYRGGSVEATYSIIDSASGEEFFGEGCLDTDPYFKLTIGNYYYLTSTACGDGVSSPAIDAGHPDSLDAILDCEQGLGTERADMGFYGGRYSPLPDGVEYEDENIPAKFSLSQNYPNPFNPTTTIKYSIPANAGVETQNLASLRIYNILGEEIATLVNERQIPGNYSVTFDASNLASGVYFYTLRVGNFVATKKMILLK